MFKPSDYRLLSSLMEVVARYLECDATFVEKSIPVVREVPQKVLPVNGAADGGNAIAAMIQEAVDSMGLCAVVRAVVVPANVGDAAATLRALVQVAVYENVVLNETGMDRGELAMRVMDIVHLLVPGPLGITLSLQSNPLTVEDAETNPVYVVSAEGLFGLPQAPKCSPVVAGVAEGIVALTCATPDVTIYYAMGDVDGVPLVPSVTQGIEYTAPFALPGEDQVLYAVAYKAGFKASDLMSWELQAVE